MAFRGSSKTKVRPITDGLDSVVAQPTTMLATRPRAPGIGISTRFRQMLSSGKATPPGGQSTPGSAGNQGRSHSSGAHGRGLGAESDRTPSRSVSKQSNGSQASGMVQMVGSSIAKGPFSARSSVSSTASTEHSVSSRRSTHSFEARSTTKDSGISYTSDRIPSYLSDQDSVDMQRSFSVTSQQARQLRAISKDSASSHAISEGAAPRAARSAAVRSIFSDESVEAGSMGGSTNSSRRGGSNRSDDSTVSRTMTLNSIDETMLPPKRSASMGVPGHAPLPMMALPTRAMSKDASNYGNRHVGRAMQQPVVHLPVEDDGVSSPDNSDDDEDDEWLQYSRNGVWPPHYMPGADQHTESPTTASSSSGATPSGKLSQMERFRLKLLRRHGFLDCQRDVRIKPRGPRV
mmetsp:Transcript_118865/g.296503  ORF Transcript_118865/g.296503 Transcript_118865/m.296503 type:complete len:404 (-) Transcript_118865:279-1490(-)